MSLLDRSRVRPFATHLVTRRHGDSVRLAIALALCATCAAACGGPGPQPSPTSTEDASNASAAADGAAANAAADAGHVDGAVDGTTAATNAVLHTSGSKLLDRCGKPILIRGLEQRLRNGIPVDNQWATLIDHIAATGSNALRVLPDPTNGPSMAELDAALARTVANGLVVFVSYDDITMFANPDVKAVLTKYEGNLIVDASPEPHYDDRAQWFTDATANIDTVRGYGYRVPFVVMANLYGRDLPSILDRGAEIVAHDPQHNVILGWQAYWGESGTYQKQFGMTLEEGFAAAAGAAFPIQAGLDLIADPPSDQMDYVSAMSAAQAHGIGWLWWDWHNPPLPSNSLSADGTLAGMNAVGLVVVETDPASIRNTSVKICTP